MEIQECIRTADGLALYHGFMKWEDKISQKTSQSRCHILAQNTEEAQAILRAIMKADFPSVDLKDVYLAVQPETFTVKKKEIA